MDLTVGNTAGRDGLIAALGGSATIDPDDAQAAWDAMCDHALWEVRTEYLTDAPPAVLDWAYDVAGALWRKRTGGGDLGVAPGDPFTTPAPFSIRRYRGTLGRYANTHRTVAGPS